MPLIPGQTSGLLAGLFLVAVYSVAYWITRVAWLRPAPASKPTDPRLDNDHLD